MRFLSVAAIFLWVGSAISYIVSSIILSLTDTVFVDWLYLVVLLGILLMAIERYLVKQSSLKEFILIGTVTVVLGIVIIFLNIYIV